MSLADVIMKKNLEKSQLTTQNNEATTQDNVNNWVFHSSNVPPTNVDPELDDESSQAQKAQSNAVGHNAITRVNSTLARPRYAPTHSNDIETKILAEKLSANNSGLSLEQTGQVFDSFDAMVKMESVTHVACNRTKISLSGSTTFYVDIPWEGMTKAAVNLGKSVVRLKVDEFVHLDCVTIKWVPLMTEPVSKVTLGVADFRSVDIVNGAITPKLYSQVEFTTNQMWVTALGFGCSVAREDKKLVKLAILVHDDVSKRKYASVDSYFATSSSNMPLFQLHSCVTPLMIPPEDKNLVRDHKRILETLKKSNASIKKSTTDSIAANQAKREMLGLTSQDEVNERTNQISSAAHLLTASTHPGYQVNA